MKTKSLLLFTVLTVAAGCSKKTAEYDATGTFEADETIVSAEVNGRITSLNINEGDTVQFSQVVGTIDATNLELQKQQVEASISALAEKTTDVAPQVKLLEDQVRVQQSQLNTLYRERNRTEKLVKADAATRKQLDDINGQIDLVQKQIAASRQQINVQKTNILTQNRSILSERKPLQKKVQQLQDQIQRSNIINPANGTVITKYAEAGEVTSAGKALYKLADLSNITLRAYITGDQLPQIKTGQQVQVITAAAGDKSKTYNGVISWISDKAEFTPKTIQTKEERANLVYAVKISVKNDGYLKLGMYADVKLNNK
jgi:HlyD family secretion protein